MSIALRVQEVPATDTSYLLVEMRVFHNNCICEIEQQQLVIPTSLSAIADLRSDTDKVGCLPFTYSVKSPGIRVNYSESLSEIVERALDYPFEQMYWCAPVPAMFQLVIMDGRENPMWHQPIEQIFVLCPMQFICSDDGSRFPYLSWRAKSYSRQNRKEWFKHPEKYVEETNVWVPLAEKQIVLTAKYELKQNDALKGLIQRALYNGRFYEDIEDGVSDALEAATIFIKP